MQVRPSIKAYVAAALTALCVCGCAVQETASPAQTGGESSLSREVSSAPVQSSPESSAASSAPKPESSIVSASSSSLPESSAEQSASPEESETSEEEESIPPEMAARLKAYFDSYYSGSAPGPITVPREQETETIQNAPAYDREEARRYIDSMPQVRALVDSIGDDSTLTAFGRITPSSKSMVQLRGAMNRLMSGGHSMSLIMVDLRTMSGVSYNTSQIFCTQSTMKAVWVSALLDQNPDAVYQNGRYMRDAILYSNNDAYYDLRMMYGGSYVYNWCLETGVGVDMSYNGYPRGHTSADMLKLWTKVYGFLNGDNDKTNFAAYFSDTTASATRDTLGDRCPVQTKAGWANGFSEELYYPFEGTPSPEFINGNPWDDECAANDAGVVYTKQGPYLFVIYSDVPYGLFLNRIPDNPLSEVVESLYALQQDIAGQWKEEESSAPESASSEISSAESSAEEPASVPSSSGSIPETAVEPSEMGTGEEG